MYTINCKGKLLVIDKPLVMGIINATPDSFYESHLQKGMEATLALADKMIGDGADILDIGGQSTRPGSARIIADEEIKRVLPVINAILTKYPDCIISIDTYHASVADIAVKNGALMVNDISGGTMDEEMLHTVGKLNVPYCCMHIKGDPATMQSLAQYENITLDVLDYFIAKIEACTKAGIKDIIIDPGFGFAKNAGHNFELLKNMASLKILGKPILAGLSRKATIYKTLGITADEALNGTTVLNTLALLNGASILRVHDVKEAREAVMLMGKYEEAESIG